MKKSNVLLFGETEKMKRARIGDDIALIMAHQALEELKESVEKKVDKKTVAKKLIGVSSITGEKESFGKPYSDKTIKELNKISEQADKIIERVCLE